MVRRRSLLEWTIGAAVLLPAAGCTVVDRVVPAPADVIEPLITAKLDLIARYDATLRQQPSLGSRLAPLRADQAAHLERLLALLHPDRRAVATRSAAPPGASSGADASADPDASAPPATPESPDAAVAAIAAVQVGLAELSRTSCLATVEERAPLLGSISASDAAHLAVLR